MVLLFIVSLNISFIYESVVQSGDIVKTNELILF